MGISAWGLLAAPFLAQAQAPSAAGMEAAMPPAHSSVHADLFDEMPLLDEGAMRDASGGAQSAVDITNLGMNFANSGGSVSNNQVNNTQTGQIANNAIDNNRGITTVFNNTGNGVVFQSTVQVNIFLNGPGY
jgi:hypothetical protein